MVAAVRENSSVTQLMTLACQEKNCFTQLRVGRFLQRPSGLRVGPMRYCPMCGGKAYQQHDDDLDYWETLAASYELPVEIVQAIYAIWDRSEHQNFGDFINVMKKEANKINATKDNTATG